MNSKVIELDRELKVVEGGIASKTLYSDSQSKIVLFQFDAGQQLSEHTASVSAIMHFLEGQAMVQLGQKTVSAKPGTWIHMLAGQLHAIEATTKVMMLLTLFLNPPNKNAILK